MQNFIGFEHTLIIIQNLKYFTDSTLTRSVINTRGTHQDFFNFNFNWPIRTTLLHNNACIQTVTADFQ